MNYESAHKSQLFFIRVDSIWYNLICMNIYCELAKLASQGISKSAVCCWICLDEWFYFGTKYRFPNMFLI